MIDSLRVYVGNRVDPYWNLAVEQYLLEHVPAHCCTLYLWQNQSTVVIGRNQNAWKECRTTRLEEEGGHLARRLSGGGAVFHDLGNLNFTFLVPTAEYDLNRQLSVIIEACRGLGIPAERSGRNDILSGGRKFSGNAFYDNGVQSYHHGTLLVDVDMERLGRYLVPSQAKLAAKGVASVQARVVNLKELCPDITIPLLKERLIAAFQQMYGREAQLLTEADLDRSVIEALARRNAGWEWNFGRQLPFTVQCEQKYDWGELQLQLQVESGVIQAARVYSDAMEWGFAAQLEEKLTGCRFSLAAMQACVQSAPCQPAIRQDLCRMLAEQEI